MNILLIDDDQDFLLSMEMQLKDMGHEVHKLSDSSKVNQLSPSWVMRFNLAIIDMRMPEVNGLQAGRHLKEMSDEIVTIMSTSDPSVSNVIEAFRDSRFDDYIPKKETLIRSKLTDLLRRAEQLSEERKALFQAYQLNQSIRAESVASRKKMIGQSSPFRAILHYIDKVAPLDSTILIQGETGTGKGVIAKEIHQKSSRNDEPFVSINCTTIPKGLMESELFGHVKGAFTGALGNKEGLFTLANGGTIFLDEIGDLSLDLQVKLLQVLQERKIRPVGSQNEEMVDVRIISATHQDLQEKIQEGEFREDLFYRLNVIPLFVPPLRERKEDIEPLVMHVIAVKRKTNPHIKGVMPEAFNVLYQHNWHGNIRELENVVERAMIWTEEDYLSEQSFLTALQHSIQTPIAENSGKSLPDPLPPPLKTFVRSSIPREQAIPNNLWKNFKNHGYKLWRIQEIEHVRQQLIPVLTTSKYVKNPPFAQIQAQHPTAFPVHVSYLNALSGEIEQTEIVFEFQESSGSKKTTQWIPDQAHPGQIQQPVCKGIPDTYFFNLLYPSFLQQHGPIGLSPKWIARSIVLRFAQCYASSATLKHIFQQTMDTLIDASLAQVIEGFDEDGLEMIRASLARKNAIFAGIPKRLKQDAQGIAKEIRQVFPDYVCPPQF
ncbi:MAG: sigma-54-dependent Fis family transcriptional regulator [SAR324 cluster bacterium]|nr:sigma-54-dependent Fis family transcriptional regulator [SAR324 cluster bacterium]